MNAADVALDATRYDGNFVGLSPEEIEPLLEYLTQALYEVTTVESRQHINHFPPATPSARSKNCRRFRADHFA
jgi:hypothetical protein